MEHAHIEVHEFHLVGTATRRLFQEVHSPNEGGGTPLDDRRNEHIHPLVAVDVRDAAEILVDRADPVGLVVVQHLPHVRLSHRVGGLLRGVLVHCQMVVVVDEEGGDGCRSGRGAHVGAEFRGAEQRPFGGWIGECRPERPGRPGVATVPQHRASAELKDQPFGFCKSQRMVTRRRVRNAHASREGRWQRRHCCFPPHRLSSCDRAAAVRADLDHLHLHCRKRRPCRGLHAQDSNTVPVARLTGAQKWRAAPQARGIRDHDLSCCQPQRRATYVQAHLPG